MHVNPDLAILPHDNPSKLASEGSNSLGGRRFASVPITFFVKNVRMLFCEQPSFF